MPVFAHPLVLWLLLPLLAAVIWCWLRPPASLAVSSASHFNPAPPRRWLAPRHLLLRLEALAGVAFTVALARPQQDIELVPVKREGIDIIISLDYSNSMDAFDPGPGVSRWEVEERIADGTLVDRLAVAREQIVRFVKRRDGDRIGLVIFGEDGYVASPPTLDHDYLLAQAELINDRILSPRERATNVAAGISTALNTLIDVGERRRAIVLITDGENSVTDEVFTPLEAAEAAADKGVIIHTVGIGANENVYLPRQMHTPSGNYFDTESLEKIASISGGRFFRATDNEGFETVMNTIDELETTSRVHPAVVYHRDLFSPIILGGFVTLLLAFLLRHSLLQEIA